VDCDQGYSDLIAHFWQEIGPLNLFLIRRISLPLYSIGLFGNVDCAMGQSRLSYVCNMIARFTGLTHLYLGVDLAECLPPSHGLFSVEATVSGTANGSEDLEWWNCDELESSFPLRDCFQEVGRNLGKKADVGIYW
jgi:hypothetical protein